MFDPVLLRTAALGLGICVLSPSAMAATDLEVCNRTGSKVFFAMAHLPDATKKWTLNAWHPVNPGSCRNVAKIRIGLFYYFAEKEGRKMFWPAQTHVDKSFCVPSTSVNRLLVGASCAAGERNLGFRGVTSNAGKYTVTLN